MLIAINGRKQSGKDTVGQIIQYLIYKNKYKNKIADITLKQFIRFNNSNQLLYSLDWKVKKFADKLKDIICILINSTREQLEDESFKSKELGEEWWYWYMEREGEYSPIILDYLTTTKKELKSYEGLELIKPTPRFLLQFIGTNLFRNQLSPEIWVNSLMSGYKQIIGYAPGNYWNKCSECGNQFIGDKRAVRCEECSVFYPDWIITDMRFPNEMEAVKKRGSITIRVNRPCNVCGGSGYHKMSCSVSKSGEHYSETALDKSEFDYIVDNDSDIESLIEKVKQILIKEKLL